MASSALVSYRDAIEAAEARIRALEEELARLRARDPEPAEGELRARTAEAEARLVEAKAALEIERQNAEAARAVHAVERESARAAFESRLEVQRVTLQEQARAAALGARVDAELMKARLEAAEQIAVGLRARVAALEAEIEALLESPSRAAIHYAERIAATRAAIASIEALGSRDRARLAHLDEELGRRPAGEERVRLEAERSARASLGESRERAAAEQAGELARLEKALERASAR